VGGVRKLQNRSGVTEQGSVQHRFAVSAAEGITVNFYKIIEQQFRLKDSIER